MTKVDWVVKELHLQLLLILSFAHRSLQGFPSFLDRCLRLWVYNGLALCLAIWLRLWFRFLSRSGFMVRGWDEKANFSNREKDRVLAPSYRTCACCSIVDMDASTSYRIYNLRSTEVLAKSLGTLVNMPCKYTIRPYNGIFIDKAYKTVT